MDWTYHEAITARLNHLESVDVAEEVDHRFGEGERESLDQWNTEHPGGVQELVLAFQKFRDAVVGAATAFQEAFSSLARAFRLIVNAQDDPAPSDSRKSRVLPVRNIPAVSPRMLLHDQRPMIRQHYAGRRG